MITDFPDNSQKNKPYTKPWFAKPTNANTDKKVIIVGGGISGASTANSLARRGYNVTIYEKNPELAMEASGNYQAVLYGHFGGNDDPNLELTLKGYQYSHNLVSRLPNDTYGICGIIEPVDRSYKIQQLIRNKYPSDFCHLVDKEQIDKIAGIELKIERGIHYPSGLWLSPKSLIHYLSNHPNIKIVCNSKVTNINYNDKWQITTNNGTTDSSYNLVLCNSHNLNEFNYTKNLPLNKTRGQTTVVRGNIGLKTIICGNGYITPNLGQHYTVGATFNKDISNMEVTNSEHIENLSQVARYITNYDVDLNNVTGKANIRMHSLDHLPIVGPIADYDEFNRAYSRLSKDKNYKLNSNCPYHPGLYINAAFGSKGFLFAPICGEIIADYINNDDLDISESLRVALHPNRFWLKEIIRNLHKPISFG